MSIRKYAEMVGFEIVGKLVKKTSTVEKFNYAKGEMETIKTVYWEDEAGNTYTKDCIVTVDGAVL